MKITNHINFIKLFIFNSKINDNSKSVVSFCASRKLDNDVFEYSKYNSLKIQDATIYYNKQDNSFSHLSFDKPMSLPDAINVIKKACDEHDICRCGIAKEDYKLTSFSEAFAQRFKNMKFTKFLGSGRSAVALENEDGQVVKLCDNDHFLLRKGEEDFDAHVYRRGNVRRRYFYYIQEKCSNNGITEKHVDEMERKILKKGYIVDDLYIGQIGFNKDGKLCLVDPECAIDKEKQEERMLTDIDFEYAIFWFLFYNTFVVYKFGGFYE